MGIKCGWATLRTDFRLAGHQFDRPGIFRDTRAAGFSGRRKRHSANRLRRAGRKHVRQASAVGKVYQFPLSCPTGIFLPILPTHRRRGRLGS